MYLGYLYRLIFVFVLNDLFSLSSFLPSNKSCEGNVFCKGQMINVLGFVGQGAKLKTFCDTCITKRKNNLC